MCYRPIQFYAAARQKNRLVPSCTNSVCVSSGRKYKFSKFQKIIRATCQQKKNTADVFTDGQDAHWEEAMKKFESIH